LIKTLFQSRQEVSVYQRKLTYLCVAICLAASLGGGAVAARAKHEKPGNAGSQVPEVPFDSKLVGLKGNEVTALLGAPSFTRRENGAEVWQYIKADCALDIFLYEKQPPEGIKVQYVDAFKTTLPKIGEPVVAQDRQRCLQLFAGHGASLPSLQESGAPIK
jgi:hypothetical protein